MAFHAFWLGVFKVDFRSLSEQLRTITFNRHVADKLTVISSVDSIWSFYCAIFHKEEQRFAFTMCKLSLYKLLSKTTLLLLRLIFCNSSKFIWFKSGNVNSIYFHAVRQTTNLNTRCFFLNITVYHTETEGTVQHLLHAMIDSISEIVAFLRMSVISHLQTNHTIWNWNI